MMKYDFSRCIVIREANVMLPEPGRRPEHYLAAADADAHP